jgi:nucleotide-binding universal stress UspA family protein
MEGPMNKITVYIDGSTYGESVCDHAVWAAQQLGKSISLVHVLGPRDQTDQSADLSGSLMLGARSALLDKLALLDAERATLSREHGRALLDEAATRIRAATDVEVTTKLRNGDLLNAVDELEGETRFAIIGKRGTSADFTKMNLGSNVDRVVRNSKRPILIASRTFAPVAQFLLAYDGGAAGNRALDRLCEGSVLHGVTCHLLSVGAATPAVRDKLTLAANRLRDAGFDVTEHLISGEPETVIAKAVVDLKISLLVMGKSGNSRLRQLFIGSTTQDLMRRCHVPVLVFP